MIGGRTPSRPLELDISETGPAVACQLTSGQVAALAARPDLVTLAPTSGGMWRIGGMRKIGAVLLGDGPDAVRLRIRPKLPIERLLFLAGYVAKPETFWHDAPLDAALDDRLESVVALLYARITGQALDRGILHGYMPVAQDVTVVRGRIDTTAQIRRFGLPIPVAVTYDDFTTDIPENRILLTAALRCIEVSGVGRTGDTVRTQLRQLAYRLDGVRPLRLGTPRPAWRPSRINAHCVPALRLAELILDATTPDPLHDGTASATGFLINMETVFESFLAQSFAEALARHRYRAKPGEDRHRLDQARRVTLKPDLTVYRHGRTVSVIDAKYKTLKAGCPSNDDLYQLTAYCTALGLTRGHLVYAAGSPAATHHQIQRTGIILTAHALELSAPVETILEQLRQIAHQISRDSEAATEY